MLFVAGSTKAEATTTPIQNHVCCGGDRPSLENMPGVILPSSASTSTSSMDVIFRKKKKISRQGASSTENLTSGDGRIIVSSEKLKEYPRSADMLELDRRSRSEER
jgi:hypothetical protein